MRDSDANGMSIYGKVVGATLACVGMLSATWGFFVDPSGNLVLRTTYAVAVLLLIATTTCVYVAFRKVRRESEVAPGEFLNSHLYSNASRTQAKRITFGIVPAGVLLILGALWIDHSLTPVIRAAEWTDDKPHQLSITGERFGSTTTDIAVSVGDEPATVLEVTAQSLVVEIPPTFEDGLLVVRRGPRGSIALRVRRNRMRYGVMVAEMFDPTDDPIQELLNQFEPYPGVPYFSRKSDHPTEWPQRVHDDRKRLFEKMKEFFDKDVVAETLQALQAKLADVEIVSQIPPNPFEDTRQIHMQYMRLRMYLNTELGGDRDSVANVLGDDVAEEYFKLEQFREHLRKSQPNRILFLRLANASNGDAENVRVEFSVGGSVYDMTVTGGDGDPSLTAAVDRDSKRVSVSKFQPSQTCEIRVWYRYESVDSRVFPDAKDFVLERTQGISIRNILVSNGFVVVDQSLVADITEEAYHAFEFDVE